MQKSNSCTTKKDGSPLSFLTFILQFSILEFPPSSSCSLEKSAKRLQIPRVKNGLLNVGTCNAYIVLFIPSFFVLPRQKCMDSNLRMYSLTKKFFVKKKGDRTRSSCSMYYSLHSYFKAPWEHRNWIVQDKQKMNKGQD